MKELWQKYVADRAARTDAYADSGQWDCLMFEATGDEKHAQAAIVQALGNWPGLNRNNRVTALNIGRLLIAWIASKYSLWSRLNFLMTQENDDGQVHHAMRGRR